MFAVAMRKQNTPQYKPLNVKQDLFCKIYATDPLVMGNATLAYQKAYKVENYVSAKTAVRVLIDKPEITARINDYLQQEGFNNENVDKQLLYVINQHRDLPTKVKGIQEFNKLKKRITNQIELVIPKPIMDDDDEVVIRKIDKKRAIDMPYDENSDTPNQ